MSCGLCVPSIVPSSRSSRRRPPSLLWVPWLGSPDSQVLLGRSDSLMHVQASLRSPSLSCTVVRPVSSLPWMAGRCVHGPGLLSRSPTQPLGFDGCIRVSQVPGQTPIRARRALGPRSDRMASHCAMLMLPPPGWRTSAHSSWESRGSSRTALAFAVYASQRGLPQRHARLASGWWLASAGRARPAGSASEGFTFSLSPSRSSSS